MTDRSVFRGFDMERESPVPVIPISLAPPAEGRDVLFWAKGRLGGDAATMDNALRGVFRGRCFWIESDSWDIDEVDFWKGV